MVVTATIPSRGERHDHRNRHAHQPRDDAGTGLRDGYAEVGDVQLHYVEAGDGPLVVLLHGFPEFWYGWRKQIARSSRPASASSRPTCAATTSRRSRTASPTTPPTSSRSDIRGLIRELGAESAMVVGHDWGGTAAWTLAANHPEVVDRLVILNAAHPRQLNEGLKNLRQLLRTWYFFYFQFPGLPERRARRWHWRFFKRFLRDARPPYTDGGARPLRRRVVPARRGEGDDRLLPRRGAPVVEAGDLPPSRRPPWSSGGRATATSAPSSPSRTTRTCPTSTGSSACPTRRTGSTTTRPSA